MAGELSLSDDGDIQIKGLDAVTLATVKPASTPASATDTSLVTALNPNTPLPTGTNALGSVIANAGTNLNTSLLALDSSVNGILLLQGSITSGQKGPLVLGAVTTSDPTYTTGQTSPLSLTREGRLRASVTLADGPQADAFGRLRVSDSDLIESIHFAQSGHTPLIGTSLTGSGTAALNTSNSAMRLTCTTSSSDSVVMQTRRYFRYNPGRSYIITISGDIGAKKANVRQRWGHFDASNGLFFQQTSTDLSVVIRTSASGSPVDTVVNQSAWNLDKLDGTGTSGITLDTSKHNLYLIDFLWHGAGRVRFGILYNGRIIYCHEYNGANSLTTPYIRTPVLPIRTELTNTGTAASPTTMDVVCLAYQKEASDTLSAPYQFTASRTNVSKSVGNTILPLLSIRPKATFNSLTNRVPIVPNNMQIAADQNLIYVVVYLNATLTGASFASVDTNSAVEFDTAATVVTGGTLVKELYVPANSTLLAAVSSAVSAAMDLITLGLDVAGSVQDTLTIAARSTGGGTNTWAQIDWQEYQ